MVLSRGKYAVLLEDEDVRRWYDNTGRGSRVTADVYLRRLGWFCRNRGVSPRGLLGLGGDGVRDVVLDYVTWGEGEGYAGSYIRSTVKAVKSWLAHNGLEVKGRVRVRGAGDSPSLRDERVPTQGELRKILLSGDKKARVACVLVAHSGLRTGVLGSYRGGDGLRVGDFPELGIVDGVVEFDVVPTMLVVRREISKAGHQYFSFLGEEGCGYLASYLEERVRLGEDVGPGSAVITPKTGSGELISTVNIGDAIRGAIRGAGFDWRPYVLRSYFDTQLMLAESRGHVLRDYRKFWMGHKGDIENRYTTNKCRLPEGVVEDMRSSYARGLEFLETEPGRGVGSVRDQFRRELLLVAGFDEREIDEKGLDGVGDEEFQSIVKQRLLGDMVNNGATQKTVDVGEVEEYLASGWEFVASLPNGRAIVKLPKQ